MEGGTSSCYINVGPSGFKFFRPTPPKQAASGGAASFPFAHFALDKIHSWSFLEKNAFSFKFFEVAEKRLVEVRDASSTRMLSLSLTHTHTYEHIQRHTRPSVSIVRMYAKGGTGDDQNVASHASADRQLTRNPTLL